MSEGGAPRIAPDEPIVVERRSRIAAGVEKSWVPPLFLALTFGTVFLAGIGHATVEQQMLLGESAHVSSADPRVIAGGLLYTLVLMAILGCHEMGHWIVARAHGVRTSLPVFIPVPFGIGTFGAVIAMKELPPTRAALVRIGAAGPLAGGVVALVAMAFAVRWAPTLPLSDFEQPGAGYMVLGDSIATRVLTSVFAPALPEGHTPIATPLFWAAWTGFLLTSINLFPVGQLDGGHVLYGLVGERANRWAKPLAAGIMLLAIPSSLLGGVGVSPGYLVWGTIVYLLASWHPPVPRPEERLPADAKLLAVLCVLLLVLTFMPSPMKLIL